MSTKKQEVSFTRKKLENALKKTSYIDEIRWILRDSEGNMPSRSSIEQKMGSGKWPSLARKYRLRYGSPAVYFNSLKFDKNGVSIFIPDGLLSAGGYKRGDILKVNVRGNYIEIINETARARWEAGSANIAPKHGKMTAEKLVKMVDLWIKMSRKELAKELNVSTQTLYYHRKQLIEADSCIKDKLPKHTAMRKTANNALDILNSDRDPNTAFKNRFSSTKVKYG